MKFQKGLLNDLIQPPPTDEKPVEKIEERPEPPAANTDHLFQTHQRAARSWRQYLKVLGIVVVFVVVAGAATVYLTLPRFGSPVRAPYSLDQAVKSHFLDVEKRTVTEMEFFFCDTYYWARVEVEKRPDIKTNPIYQIGSYTARATSDGEDKWAITAAPTTAPDTDIPCQ